MRLKFYLTPFLSIYTPTNWLKQTVVTLPFVFYSWDLVAGFWHKPSLHLIRSLQFWILKIVACFWFFSSRRDNHRSKHICVHRHLFTVYAAFTIHSPIDWVIEIFNGHSNVASWKGMANPYYLGHPIEFSRSLVLIQSCNRHAIRANVICKLSKQAMWRDLAATRTTRTRSLTMPVKKAIFQKFGGKSVKNSCNWRVRLIANSFTIFLLLVVESNRRCHANFRDCAWDK